jgi:integrase
MSKKHSTKTTRPNKPSPDFPLFPHATGRWAKKIKGKLHYFGRWNDPEGALQEYRDFLAGKAKAGKTSGVNGCSSGVEEPTPVPDRPAKPSPDFPLFPHASGYWAKKIRGKLHYFGPWNDPDAALTKYLEQKDALHAGRKPRNDSDAVTMKAAVNAFLTHKSALRQAGELAQRTLTEYTTTAAAILAHFGSSRLVEDIGPDDFLPLRRKMARKVGPVRLCNEIQRVRSVFKHAFDSGLIDRPVRFGPGFARPSKKVLRLQRAQKGIRMFEAEELRCILGAATMPLKAMILLGVNCGFGNADCGTLPLTALDLDGGWVNYHRPKTGIDRRCPLWPETVQALRDALTRRPEPKKAEDAKLAFITKYGGSWHKEIEDNPISKEMRKLLDSLEINGSRNFYALRHTFETIGGEAKDQVAVDHIMGHARDDMASAYRERVSDSRLRAVADHVHAWLFGGQTNGTNANDSAPIAE